MTKKYCSLRFGLVLAGLKLFQNLPFLQILSTVTFIFFFRTDFTDSPTVTDTSVLSISVFTF